MAIADVFCSLADLNDELTMPSELRRAHTQNDKAVMKAYGFSIKDSSEEIFIFNQRVIKV
ncbi:MAG: hypothetical protein LUE96_00640 [Lachnospiraceae bacterium]|nr:hypothetical protein [Lachnospiraceae bacterium]